MHTALEKTSEVQLSINWRRRSDGTRVQTGSQGSDVCIDAESEGLRIYGRKGRVMKVAVQMLSDAAIIFSSKCTCRHATRSNVQFLAPAMMDTMLAPKGSSTHV